MKRIAAALIILSLASCGSHRGSKQVSVASGRTPGWSVIVDNESEEAGAEQATGSSEDPDYIHVKRNWREIDPAAFVRKAPTQNEVKKWRAEFEKAFDVDSVWIAQLNLYKDTDQFFCDCDLVELLHGRYRDEFPESDRRTEWRLLQYAGSETPFTGTELQKVLHLRDVWEELLDRELDSQMDMNLHSWLVTDMQEFQIRLMYEVCSKHLPQEAAEALLAEKDAAEKAHSATSDAYQKIDGTPDGFNGSSYPYRVASFGAINLDMEIEALESFMCSLLADSLVTSKAFVSLDEARKLVEREYSVMESRFDDDEYSFPVKTRTEYMEKDRECWEAWMSCRTRMSALLSGKQKDTYDSATVWMYRHKLISLKNRYETGNFSPMYYEKILLDYVTPTTEEILSHNFEKLLEKELSN